MHRDFLRDFDSFIPFYQLYYGHFWLCMSQKLSDTASSAKTESHKGTRMNSIAFFLPPLWSEHKRVFEVLRIEVVSKGLCGYHSPLGNLYIFYHIVFNGLSEKNSIDRTIYSCSLILKPVDISEFFQIFRSYIFIWLDKGIDFISDFLMDIGAVSKGENDHRKVTGGTVGSSYQ